MTTVQKSALVKFSAQQMFDIVNDIESYPEYFSWCKSSRILEQTQATRNAELVISKGGLQKAFSTHNKLKHGGKIHMTLLNGPFKSLEGVWDFKVLREDASKISLDLNFEVNGKLAGFTFGAVFSQLCDGMVSTFNQRAKQLYG
ncbi:MAG: type II toxin-antitoxin system RatA family toxin [Methylococcales bacterium]|nr:type II toxin-antitoxin system RatA family toxin [Methylococcales bacterium]MCK5924373.1 type II toxin-antitoxin system RatA family toxin [Methylococcales bacterium]